MGKLRRVAPKDAPWERHEPQDLHGAIWNWWDKVRCEVEARKITVKDLAEATEIPYRSLHRWLYEAPDLDMRERGPQGELSIVARLSYALGWAWWYTAGAAWQWPPSEGPKRLMESWERLIDMKRFDTLEPVAHAMAACCEATVETILANQETRSAMKLEVLQRLENSPADRDPEGA